jgi:glycosyltransferase involved in cell wall biosynthesis
MGLFRIAESLPRPLRRALRRVPGAARLRTALAGTPRGPQPDPGSLRPVVYLPTWARWGEMRQRPQYLIAALAAAGHPAYFVDPREAAPRRAEGVAIVPSLRHVPRRHVLLYVHFAPLRALFARFRDAAVVYDVLDDLAIYDPDERDLPEHRRVRAHHPEVLATAAVALASSSVLAERHRPQRPDLLLVENGVDLAAFQTPHPRPADLPAGRPLIGYHGALARWLDVGLLSEVATKRPDWEFVLVGPVLDEARAGVERLGRLGNVHLLGSRASDEVPAYVRAFDAAVIPFVVDDLTAGVSPLKMFESLAADVPVVATPLPACRDVGGVRVAATAAEMVAAITEALDAAPREREARRSAAEAAAWPRRVAPLLERLDELGLRRVPG